MINKRYTIEDLRQELHFLISYKEPTDISVVKCSQKLDKLIVQYEKNKLFKMKSIL